LTSGACQTVKIKNDTILIGMGNSIVVLTLENDNSINEVAKINIQGEVQDLYIEDNHVFVLSQCTSPDGYYYNLSVVQLSPISSVIGSIVINAKNIEAFTYFNNYILVFSGDLNELIFINTNNFSQPFIEQSYDYIYRRENGWPEVVWRFATKDSLLYCIGVEGITVIKDLGSLNFEVLYCCDDYTFELENEIFIYNTNMYICGWSEFFIYDITSPENPELINETKCDPFDSPFISISATENQLQLLSYEALNIYDITDKQNPVKLYRFALNGVGSDIAVSENYMFITQYYKGLTIIDNDNPSFDDPIAKYEIFGFIKDMYIYNNHLYALSSLRELYIFDINELSSPILENSLTFPNYNLYEIMVYNGVAYITARRLIYIVNVNNPENITFIDSIAIDTGHPSLTINDNRLFVIGDTLVNIYNLENPVSPNLIGSYKSNKLHGLRFTDINIKGHYAYVLDDTYRNLSIIDISDPTSPSLVSEISVKVAYEGKCSIWLDHLFITTARSIYDIYSQDINIFDISNPITPKAVGQVSLGEQVFSVCGTSGDYLFTISKLTGLSIYNVSNTSNIQEAGAFNLDGGANQWTGSLIVQNNVIFIGSEYGLYIIRNDNNSSPSIINCLPDTTIRRNDTFKFTYDAFDVDGDELTYQIKNASKLFEIDESSGLLKYIPNVIQNDTSFSLIVTINDTKTSKQDTAEINIIGINSFDNSALEIPEKFSLNQNYPNPFNTSTNMSFTIPNRCTVNLKICNILGKEVTTLVNDKIMDAGRHRITWDASDLPSGIYFYQIKFADHYSAIRKCVLMK
jgi:hypothetical protein